MGDDKHDELADMLHKTGIAPSKSLAKEMAEDISDTSKKVAKEFEDKRDELTTGKKREEPKAEIQAPTPPVQENKPVQPQEPIQSPPQNNPYVKDNVTKMRENAIESKPVDIQVDYDVPGIKKDVPLKESFEQEPEVEPVAEPQIKPEPVKEEHEELDEPEDDLEDDVEADDAEDDVEADDAEDDVEDDDETNEEPEQVVQELEEVSKEPTALGEPEAKEKHDDAIDELQDEVVEDDPEEDLKEPAEKDSEQPKKDASDMPESKVDINDMFNFGKK